MDRSLRWKTMFLAALVIFSAVYLLPSTGAKLPTWFSRIFSKKVQMGLDLQGGLRIVYSVNLDKVIEDRAGSIRRDLEDEFRKKGLTHKVQTPRSPLGAVYVVPAEGQQVDGKVFSEFEKDEVLGKVACTAELKAKNALCGRVKPEFAEKLKESALEQAIRTIKDRVDRYGVAEPTIIRKGDDIIVELPGIDKEQIARLKAIISRTAQLEFKIVDDNTEYMQQLAAHVRTDPNAAAAGVTAETDVWDNEEKGRFADHYLTSRDKPVEHLTKAEAEQRGCILQGEARADGKYPCKVPGRRVIEDYVAALPPELHPAEDHQIGYEKVELRVKKGQAAAEQIWRTYYIKRLAELDGTMISSSDVTWNPTSNRPEVLVTFNRQGADRFGDLTSKNVGRKMAIILDDEVSSAPVIQSAITGGRSTITMGESDPRKSQVAAQDLVNVLRTGALKAPLRPESESEVGAMLGQDAIDKAKLSMIVGAILVILLMLYFYRFSGVIATFALTMNILFQISILAAFQATLTLPGIAALVLTIGMAVDANIIIYERIREELRGGKSVRGAVDAGFNRAFWTVFDAQVTTFVAGFVLLQYGTGPIRGFAVMLIIGVICNLFTSTWASRLMFDHYVAGRKASTATISI